MKEKLIKIIKEYLNETIATKKGMKKRIYELEKDLKEARENEKYATEQANKYKKKLRELRKKGSK